MSIFTLEELLIQAKLLCLNRGVNLTSQRAKVLCLMAKKNSSISAYDLLDELRMSEPKAKPATIYRALSFLLKQGFIHRVESNNSYFVCYNFTEPPHTSVILVCERCSSINEKHVRGVEKILSYLANKIEFSLHRSVVEVHGLCETCKEIESFKKS